MAHGVHLSGLGDVAALDVGDDGHARLTDGLQGVGIGFHAVQTQRLVVRDLDFVAAGDRLGGFDELFVEADDVLALGQGAVHKVRGQITEVGIQADADRAARLNSFVQFVHVRHSWFLRCSLHD